MRQIVTPDLNTEKNSLASQRCDKMSHGECRSISVQNHLVAGGCHKAIFTKVLDGIGQRIVSPDQRTLPLRLDKRDQQFVSTSV